MTANGIVSLGYEGRTIDEMVALLSSAGVTSVADVRLNAISRKPGFSKTRLREALAGASIVYRHLRELGNPKENRAPFWEGRLEDGRAAFRSILDTEDARSAINELQNLAASELVAVLCFEADHEHCHRHVVVDEVQRLSPDAVKVVRV